MIGFNAFYHRSFKKLASLELGLLGSLDIGMSALEGWSLDLLGFDFVLLGSILTIFFSDLDFTLAWPQL